MTVQQDQADQPAAAEEVTWSSDLHREVIKWGDDLLTHLFCSSTHPLELYAAPTKLNPLYPRASDQTYPAQWVHNPGDTDFLFYIISRFHRFHVIKIVLVCCFKTTLSMRSLRPLLWRQLHAQNLSTTKALQLLCLFKGDQNCSKFTYYSSGRWQDFRAFQTSIISSHFLKIKAMNKNKSNYHKPIYTFPG